MGGSRVSRSASGPRGGGRDGSSVRHLSFALRFQITVDGTGHLVRWHGLLIDAATGSRVHFTDLAALAAELARATGVDRGPGEPS